MPQPLPSVVCVELLLVKPSMQLSADWSHGPCPKLDILSVFGRMQSGVIAID